MGCNCHLIHLAAEKAAKSLSIPLSIILKEAIESKFDVKTQKILKHVCTRDGFL